MSRASKWRQNCPPCIRELQYLASVECNLYLLRQSGPVSYVIQQDDVRKLFHVRLGDPHSCTCSRVAQDSDLCVHICWVLLKKLKLKPRDPLSYQLGLVPREIETCINQRQQKPTTVVYNRPKQISDYRKNLKISKRPIGVEDYCPICLDTFETRKLPVTHCMYSCGNAVHARCMLLVAKHQLNLPDIKSDSLLTCPLCRGVFGSGRELWEEIRRTYYRKQRELSPLVSHDVACTFCHTGPVNGYLYRCAVCTQVLLCASCVGTAECQRLHLPHGFAVRKAVSGLWQRVSPNGQSTTVLQSQNKTCPLQRKLSSSSRHESNRMEECNKYYHLSELRCHSYPNNAHQRLRRQNATQRNYHISDVNQLKLVGPPEVRVIRMSLSARPKEVKPSVQCVTITASSQKQDSAGSLPRVKSQKHDSAGSLPRVKSQKKVKKKTSQRKTNSEDTGNGLALSITSGRALSAQVHPLMAVLMSPRKFSDSFHTDISKEDEELNEHERESPKKLMAKLTVTSLVLPENASKAVPSYCLPKRRLRMSARRLTGAPSVVSLLSASGSSLSDKDEKYGIM